MSGASASRREILAGAGLLVLGVGVRLAYVLKYPTIAFSDFRALIDFGLAMRGGGWAAPTWHWIQFNPGIAMALSLVDAIFPDPETAARHATAALTGFLPLFPFLLWRGILSLSGRVGAGLFLVLWPGQIFFSGVVAQENWVLVPTVALGALAVRVLRRPPADSAASPIWAGILLAVAAAFRQEMLLVLIPAAVAAAGLFGTDPKRLSRALALVVSAAVPLLALAFQRHAASGRFTIATEHGGLALLGAVVPGAAKAGWVDPRAHIAAVHPEFLENRTAARRAAGHLALKEWKRRPAFQLLRAASVSGRLAVESDADSLYWSVGAPEALPETLRPAGAGAYARWFPRLRWELALIQGLFVASVLVAIRRRDAAILVLAACVMLKFALQSAASPLGRLMMPATALELLAIPLGLAALSPPASRLRFGLVTALVAAALLIAEPKLTAIAIAEDERPLPVARFPLEIAGAEGHVQCVVEDGEVASLEWRRAWLRSVAEDRPARVRCRIDGDAQRLPLILRFEIPPGEPRETRLDGGLPSSGLEITLTDAGGFSFSKATPATGSTP